MDERIEAHGTPLLLAIGLGGLLALVVVSQADFRTGLVALVVATVMAVAFFNPRAVLFFLPFAIALTPEIPALGIPLRLEDFLMLPLAAGWLARQCVFKIHQRTPVDRLLLTYIIVGVFATLWGGYLGTVNLLAISKDFGAPFHILKRLEFVFLFLVVVDTLKTPRDVQRMTYVLIAAMVGLCAVSLGQYQGGDNFALSIADPGHEAGLGAMISVALGLSLLPAARPWAKLLLIAIIMFALASLPSTLGRNYIATTAIIMLYIGLFHYRWVLLGFPVVWALSLFVYPSDVVNHVLTLAGVFDISGADESGAALIGRAGPPTYFGLLSLGHSPLLGFGLASQSLGAFDSEYTTQLFYTGLIGLATFVLLQARLFRLAADALRAARDPIQAAVARGFHLILFAYVVHSVFSAGVSASRVGAVFFLVAGLLVVLHRSVAQQAQELPAGTAGAGSEYLA